MVTFATQALKEIYKKDYGYKKAGTILYDISPDTGTQNILFDNIDRPKHTALMQTMDLLNAHHGKNTISIGAQGTGIIPAHQGNISPRYTTHWSEIMVAKV